MPIFTCKTCKKYIPWRKQRTESNDQKPTDENAADSAATFLSITKQEFQFLDPTTTPEETQFAQACANMHHNAALLRKSVGKYISKYKVMNKAPTLQNAIERGIPVAKLVAVGIGAGNFVDMAERIWGSIVNVCTNVVERSCTDLMLAAQCVDLTASSSHERDPKEIARACFEEIRKCLQIETYEQAAQFANNPSLRKFISSKLLTPMTMIATFSVQVETMLNARECNARMARTCSGQSHPR